MTLVLPLRAEAGIAGLVTAGLDTIALRVPAHRAMQALLRESGAPLAAPSANASGGISPTRAEHVAASLGNRVDLILDDGRTTAGVESTIVAGGRILRPGPVTAEELARFAIEPGDHDDGKITAPGQLASHYAPAKPVRLNASSAARGEWLIGYGAVGGQDTLSAARRSGRGGGEPVRRAPPRRRQRLHRHRGRARARGRDRRGDQRPAEARGA